MHAGLASAMVGMNVGETREVQLTLPDNFEPAALRGVSVTCQVGISELFEYELAEVGALQATMQPSPASGPQAPVMTPTGLFCSVHFRSVPFRFYLVCYVLSCPVLSCPVLSFLFFSFLFFSSLFFSSLFFSSLLFSCLVFSFLVAQPQFQHLTLEALQTDGM